MAGQGNYRLGPFLTTIDALIIQHGWANKETALKTIMENWFFEPFLITGWQKLQYFTEPPSVGWNKLKYASEPPVPASWNKLLYSGE